MEDYIKYMTKWFISDTIELLDMVLTDDVVDPHYSGVTTLNRIWVYLQYKKETDKFYNGNECKNISTLFPKWGYSTEDIELFRKKVQEERKIYMDRI